MKPLVKWPLIMGCILFITGPAIGILGTILEMTSVFQHAAASGVTEAEILADNISTSLTTTMIGILVGFCGLLLLLFSLVASLLTRHNQAPATVDEFPR